MTKTLKKTSDSLKSLLRREPRRNFIRRAFAALAGLGTVSAGMAAAASTREDQPEDIHGRRAVDPYLGEIMQVGFNFAPRGWAFCDGQLLPIASNSALFSLLGTTYGGDGRTTFGLPDLRGRTAVHPGNAPGLTNRIWGERGGQETHVLTVAELPSHNHTVNCLNEGGDQSNPGGHFPAGSASTGRGTTVDTEYATSISSSASTMNSGTIAHTGGNLSHNNMQPYLCVFHCIAMQGTFPSRS